jgi:hypothetical protein
MVAVKQQLAVPSLVVLRLDGGNAKSKQLQGYAGIQGPKAEAAIGYANNKEACKASQVESCCTAAYSSSAGSMLSAVSACASTLL